MEKNNKTSKSQNSSNLQAGVAGAGGGTLLLLLAENLPETSEYKSWIILIAPTLSVGLAAFWKWLSTIVDNYIKKRKLEWLKNKLREDIENAIGNPNIPSEDKSMLKKKLAQFEIQNINSLVKSIEIE